MSKLRTPDRGLEFTYAVLVRTTGDASPTWHTWEESEADARGRADALIADAESEHWGPTWVLVVKLVASAEVKGS